MNKSFRRMATLVLKCLENNEPVLLIGETGCGKTTLCQLLAYLRKSKFFSINCHQFTESSDFLGSLRPLRQKELVIEELHQLLIELGVDNQSISHIMNADLNLDERLKFGQSLIDEKNYLKFKELLVRSETLFEWQDGPLIEAMREGGVFLIDEISLAEDSVLERLNSVLESERSLTVPEKANGGESNNSEQIVAHKNFCIVATMNPGGDFGKRELTPALRNR